MKKYICLLLNFINAALVIYAVSGFFFIDPAINLGVTGTRCFRYYTIDSNILSAIASILVIIFALKKTNSNWLLYFKFTATTAVAVTFLTVMFFLGPTMGYKNMLSGSNFYLHLICPIISLITYMIPDVDSPMAKRTWLYGISTVIIYSTIYSLNVLVFKTWPDFYGFNATSHWYISAIAMIVAGLGLSYILYRMRRVYIRKFVKK